MVDEIPLDAPIAIYERMDINETEGQYGGQRSPRRGCVPLRAIKSDHTVY